MLKATPLLQNLFMSTTNSITVIVPIYNAPDDLLILCDSLLSSYPKAQDDLHFIFSDDCSPDVRISEVLKSHSFFSRSDVTVMRTPVNGGFIRNVNFAIGKADVMHDIVLLNSDTEIFGDVFRLLRKEAYVYGRVGSVTPFSNNATIANIFEYPEGCDLPKDISSRDISLIVEEMNLPTDTTPAPTGVGFCMYMRRDAINVVGTLDEIFGRGYGEECDWCRRAEKAGYVNLISPKAFVHHSGTKSFLSEDKKKYIRLSEKILTERHPEYNRIVAEHVQRDPYRMHRIAVWLNLAKKLSPRKSIVLQILHASPDAIKPGGTERYVREMSLRLATEGYGVMEIYPLHNGYGVNVFCRNTKLGGANISKCQLGCLVENLSGFIDVLYLNHALNWSEEDLNSLLALNVKRRIAMVHDYFFACPGVNMINQQGVFCDVESDGGKCDKCARKFKPGFKGINHFRRKFKIILGECDVILTPSESALKTIAKAYPMFEEKFKTINHDLSYLAPFVVVNRDTEKFKRNKPLVAFVGAIHKHKGAGLLRETINHFNDEGTPWVVFGEVEPGILTKNEELNFVCSYNGIKELRNLLFLYKPDVVCFASSWAETFCYSFFEAVLCSPSAIPVVGPFGNPADVVREFKMGVVFDKLTAAELIAACNVAFKNEEKFSTGVKDFIAHHVVARKGCFYQFKSFLGVDSTSHSSATARFSLDCKNQSRMMFAFKRLTAGSNELSKRLVEKWAMWRAVDLKEDEYFYIDILDADRVSGWCLSKSLGSPIYAFFTGRFPKWAKCKIPREDVAKAFDNAIGSSDSGFSIRLPEGNPSALYFVFKNGAVRKVPSSRFINLQSAKTSSSESNSSRLNLIAGERDAVAFIAADNNASKRYRCDSIGEALQLGNQKVYIALLQEADFEKIYSCCHTLVVHRCSYSESLAGFVGAFKASGGKVVFDIDDLVFNPDKMQLIDEYNRMNRSSRSVFLEKCHALNKMMSLSDVIVVSTMHLKKEVELAFECKKVFVIPNLSSQQLVACSESSAHEVKLHKTPDRIRIGYFSGSQTHQKDFDECKNALLRILKEFPSVDLVLGGFLDLDSVFDPYKNQIIQIPFRHWTQLPRVMAMLDVNIAPLVLNNDFVNGKSEIKYTEAALLEVPTIASRASSYQYAIKSGLNGVLVDNSEQEWYASLRHLVEDADVRCSMGKCAKEDVLCRYTTSANVPFVTDLFQSIRHS